jgi:hypothetical protein
MAQKISPKDWPEDLFLLYPANRDFLEGKSRRIIGHNPVWRVVSGFSLVFMTCLYLQGPVLSDVKSGLTGTPNPWDLGTILATFGIAAIPMLIALRSEIKTRSRNRRLVQIGRLIRGKVVSSKPSSLTSKYGMDLRYEFITPDGRQCTGKDTLIAFEALLSFSDPNFTRPATGTPVLVLYADDKTFRVL